MFGIVARVRYGRRVVTKYSLNEAQAAVLSAVQQIAHDFDPVISEAEAATLAREINAFTDTFGLDEWVFASPLLKKWFCRFPLCFNPPRPPGQDDGSRRGGNQPAYCAEGVDEFGKSHNDPKYAGRRRDALRRERGTRATPGSAEESGGAEDRPVSQARTTMAAQIAEVVRRFEELSGQVQNLAELAVRAGDEDLRYGEIRAVQLHADERVAHETRLRLAAEAAKRTAEQEANRVRSELEEAADIVTQLTEEADSDREARLAAEQDAQAAHRDAEAQIASAQERFDRELGDRAADMAAQIAAAVTARDAAVTAAAERERETGAQVAAAEQAVADARDAHAAAQAEASRLREENTALHQKTADLRDAAIKREQRIEATLAELTATHQRQQNDLHATIGELHSHAAKTTADHQRAMDELRAKHEEDLATKLAEAAATTERNHQAQVAALTAHLETLRARLGE